MGTSSTEGKQFIRERILTMFPRGVPTLDVGPGSGTYRNLLPPAFEMDAVEVFEPYIDRFRLRTKYREVFHQRIQDFVPLQKYELAIFGDVLEHLSVEDAQKIIHGLGSWCKYSVFSVPWTYRQSAINGNPAEEHLQPDLTPTVMYQRYPQLVCSFTGKIIGVYEWFATP